MVYTVEMTPGATRDLKRITGATRRRIVSAIEALATNPLHRGAVKIAGKDNAFRVRVGVYRILYEIHDQRLVVLVVRVGHRRVVYRE
jgi:mRNA interferase RelE/StbE